MMNSTMISYTPIEQLPMPPKFMLDELEQEITKYNTFLMSQILTIREARPIRLAFRQKFKTHPVAKLLKEEAKNYKKNMTLDEFIYMKINSEMPGKVFDTLAFIPKEVTKHFVFQKGKFKGCPNKKNETLAYSIQFQFGRAYYSRNRDSTKFDEYRAYFVSYLTSNFKNNKPKYPSQWNFTTPRIPNF